MPWRWAPPSRGVVGADGSRGAGAPQRSRQDLGLGGLTCQRDAGLAAGGHLQAVLIRSAMGHRSYAADGHEITETNP